MSIPKVKLPEFEMIIPSTEERIKFRPFLVKEEKMLILAAESDDTRDIMNAVGNIVEECTYKKLSITTSPLFDIQHAFLQIRSKSVGGTIDFVVLCAIDGCGGRTDATINTEDFKIKRIPGHDKKLLLDNGLNVLMRYPTYEEFSLLFDTKDVEQIYRVIAQCIVSVFTEDEVSNNTPETLNDFIEFLDSLTPQQFNKIETFFATMPTVEHTVDFTCSKCGKENKVIIDGINNFFE